jgi:ABC-type branched-subunit amino acid transport system substrate-binding protein
VRKRSATLVVLFLLTLACKGENGPDGVAASDRSGPGVSDTEIRLGILSDESGPRKAIGLPRVNAARVFFQALNDQGGINGRRVRLVVADHQFNPEVATAKYREMRDSVLMIEQIYPLAFLRDDLIRDGVLASPVARFSRLAGDRHLVMTGTPYRVEMSNAVDWLAGTLADPHRTRIAAVTQADDYGADGLAGIEEAASSHGLQLVTTLTYQPTDVDFSSQVATLKASGAQYVFMTSTPRVTAEIIKGCAGIGFTPSFLGSYFSFHPQIIADNPALKPLVAKSLKTSGPFARWGEAVPGMKAMLDAISRYAPEQTPDPLFLHGWIQAGIVAEVLKQAAEMDNLTRPGILNALESMPAVELGGLSPSLLYGREARGRPPSQQTRMFDIYVDHPKYPDMLKPITEFYIGETAVAR